MKNLIEALTILLKYAPDLDYPTHCEHDVLIVNVDPHLVSSEDIKSLEELGFFASNESDDSEYGDAFYSYKYGSC